jgi:hypothetical protein
MHHYLMFVSNLTRNSLAQVISAIAKIELPVNLWPQLLESLINFCNSADVRHREVDSLLLTE